MRVYGTYACVYHAWYAVVPFWLYHGIAAILPLVLVEALDDRLKRLQVVKVRLCGLVAAEFDRTTKKHRRTVWR